MTDTEQLLSDSIDKISELSIENYRLKAQIEKMKDCSNCKYRYIQDNADLGEGTRTDPCLSCRSHNMWELENDRQTARMGETVL